MTIPTLNQLYTAIIADLETELNITVSTFGRSYLRAKAMVQAGRIWLLYLTMAMIQKNVFADTCDTETLIRFGNVKLGRDPFPATQGQYETLCSGTVGAIIPESQTFIANDDSSAPGKLFILDSEFTLDGINLITLRALEGGTDSQLQPGDELTPTAPISLVDSTLIIQSETIQPQDAEDIEDYRDKVLAAYRLEPQGGSAADYRLWATEVQGITQAYPYAAPGETNEVNLYIESDEPNGVPTTQDLIDVQASIEDPTTERPSRKPVTVIVNYLPITPLDIDITITGYVNLTAAKEALILSALEVFFSEIRPYVSAIDVLADKNDYFDINSIISVILEAVPGSIFTSVAVDVAGGAVTSYTFSNGDIPLLNTVTYA